ALNGIRFESASVLDLLHPFCLKIFGRANLCLDSTVLRLHDKNFVIELSDLQSDLILNGACLSAACFDLRARNVVSSPDLEKLGKRLDQSGATSFEGLSSLIDSQRTRRNFTVPHSPKSPGRNLDELSIRQMDERAVITDCREVGASGYL